MLTQELPNTIHAKLVMDSRKTLVAVRGQNFTGSWSQLYKAGDLYLDLSLRNNGIESVLMGHLVTDASSPVAPLSKARLTSEKNQTYMSDINSTGSFRLPAQRGLYRLELELQGVGITIDRLEI